MFTIEKNRASLYKQWLNANLDELRDENLKKTTCHIKNLCRLPGFLCQGELETLLVFTTQLLRTN